MRRSYRRRRASPSTLYVYESYTATPVFGSATAETSATVRFAHPPSVCQDGLPMYALQPLPAPLQTVSVQPRGVARAAQARATHGNHVFRGRRELDPVPVVARADGDRNARMVVVRGLVRGLAGVFTAAVRVGDHGRAQPDRRVDGGTEVGQGTRARLDEEDLAIGADGTRHVQVERDLLRPAAIGPRGFRPATLVDLSEAAVRRRARGDTVLLAVDVDVVLRVRIVIRIDDRDRLSVRDPCRT